MADEPITVGSTYRFRRKILKDGTAWDLTAATVTFYFRRPDGTSFTRVATFKDAFGVTYYDSLTTDLDKAGLWNFAIEVLLGALSLTTAWIGFNVEQGA